MRLTSVRRPGSRPGSSRRQSSTSLSGVTSVPTFSADRVLHAREELHVRAVELVGAVADPEQVRGAVVPVAGEAVAAGERLLVAEQQRLVRRVEVDLVELGLGVEVDAARGHEPQRAVDLLRELVVAAALAAARDELEVPLVRAAQVGETALGERAQQVERRRGLVVAAHHPLRVGPAGRGLELEVVDDVAEERRQLDAVALSRWAPSAAWRTGPRCGRPSASARRCCR